MAGLQFSIWINDAWSAIFFLFFADLLICFSWQLLGEYEFFSEIMV